MLNQDELAEMFKAMSEDPSNIRVIDNPQELIELLTGSEDQEGPSAGTAITMTARKAATIASAAMLGATDEFVRGHKKCAKYKMNASAMWMSIAEFFERLEVREAQSKAFQQTLDEAKRQREDQLREDAVSGNGE